MDPVKAFQQEREQAIASYRQDEPFEQLSQRFLQRSMEQRYVYNFDWLGRPVIQYPQDMCAVQEIVWATQPDVIIETGIAHGGSLILSAEMMLRHLGWNDAADLVIDGMNGAIQAKTVTYDFARLTDNATEVFVTMS